MLSDAVSYFFWGDLVLLQAEVDISEDSLLVRRGDSEAFGGEEGGMLKSEEVHSESLWVRLVIEEDAIDCYLWMNGSSSPITLFTLLFDSIFSL